MIPVFFTDSFGFESHDGQFGNGDSYDPGSHATATLVQGK